MDFHDETKLHPWRATPDCPAREDTFEDRHLVLHRSVWAGAFYLVSSFRKHHIANQGAHDLCNASGQDPLISGEALFSKL